MNHEPNIPNPQPEDSRAAAAVPTWIFALLLVLLFCGGVYFDRRSGWFDDQVYTPFGSSDELEAYQPKSGAAALFAQGGKTYDLICATCHGTDGAGKPGQAPPLAASEWVNVKGFKRLVEIPQLGLTGTVHVKGQEWNLSMAAMGVALSDSDLASVLTFIRGSWGNKGEPVTADDVKAVRAAVAGHPAIGGEQGLNAIKE